MVSDSTALLTFYGVAGLFSLPFGWLFWNQDVRGNRYMAGLMVGGFLTNLTYAGSLLADGLTATLSWYYVYLTVLSINAMLFVSLAFVWTDRRELLRPSLFGPATATLVAVPLVGLAGLVVGDVTFGSLVWAEPGVTELGSLSVFDRQPGPLGLLWRIGATSTILVMLVLLGEFTIRPEQRLYRKQNALMIAGALSVTVLAIAAQLAGVPVEISPVGYLLTATIFGIAITRFGYFDVVPLATNSIVEELDAGVLVYDTSGRVLDANQPAEEMLGLSCDPGTDVLELVNEAGIFETPVADTQLEEIERKLDGYEFTTTMSDRECHISVSVSEVRGTSEAVIGHGLLLYDVTEKHRREQRLQRQKAQLDQFASVVSHDLRNPLGIAQTYLDFAAETGDPNDFAAVSDALDRMDAMIDDLLTMARAETVVDEREPIALAEMAIAAWQTVETDGATLERQVDATTIDGNPDLLRNVFENLFRNAVEHNAASNQTQSGDTPAHDGALTVTVGTLTDRDGFYVADDGAGIPEDDREDVFEYGYSTGTNGTGFGLSIVSDIVDAHGWEITVRDGDDGGARFEVVTD